MKKPVPLTFENARRYLIRKGDAFVVRGNGSKELCGLSGLVSEETKSLIFPDLLIRVSILNERLLSNFSVAVWNSWGTRKVIEEKAKTTSGIWKITQTHIATTSIPVPSIPEQRRIVAELDALLPAILDRAFKGEL